MNKELLNAFHNLAKINKIELSNKAYFLEDMPDIMLKDFLSNKSFSSFDIINLKATSKKMKDKLSGEYYDNLIKKKIEDETNEILEYINNDEIEGMEYTLETLLNETNLSIYSDKDIPVGIGHLKNLRELQISGRHKTIPESIGKLSSLKSLVVTNAELEYLPESIKNLNLIVLDVSNNLLKEIPESIGDMISLIELTISYNKISKLPSSIGNLQNLKYFDFNNNFIKEFPESMLNLPKLILFDYDYNCYGTSFISKNPSIGFNQLTNVTQKVLKKQDPDVELSFSKRYVKKNICK